ncbi:MAG: hypothetical protein K0Q91_718 [Fibrobacteria bacterium]|jgi:hypothetical protein|nr:hypothetical protein [Fibrobacteria bacterium]
MNVLLWILQGLFALHTLMGAIWKFANPAKSAIPTLAAIPHGLWITISVLELLAAAALVVPALNKSWGVLVPIAALFVVAVMALYCVVHLASGSPEYSPLVYWIIVAVVGAFIAYGRLALRPL